MQWTRKDRPPTQTALTETYEQYKQ